MPFGLVENIPQCPAQDLSRGVAPNLSPGVKLSLEDGCPVVKFISQSSCISVWLCDLFIPVACEQKVVTKGESLKLLFPSLG